MNKSCVPHALFAAVLCLLAAGSASAVERPGENAGIAMEQVGVLSYPSSMLYNGIYSGEVRIVISVDEQGRLTDSLVTGYTHQDFANSAVAAIKRWKFQPALVRGEPRSSRAEVHFEFRNKGVVVQSLPGALEGRMVLNSFSDSYVYAPYGVRDLDVTPTPIQIVKPVAKGDDHSHKVTVGFFIDEEGRTRMPAVNRSSADDLYAAAAVVAVEQWRFNPPLRKGRPVLVYTEQPFTFNPTPSAPRP
jgi:TonB family protein